MPADAPSPTRKRSEEYLEPGRLEDCIALIQILGLDEYTNRGENALRTALRDAPNSAPAWVDLAKKHPEFFRVHDARGGPSVALIARYLTGSVESGPVLSPEYIHGLVEAAIRLHGGQLQRRQVARIAWAAAALAVVPGVLASLVTGMVIVATR